MAARVLAGWITPEDLAQPEEETVSDETAVEAEASASGSEA